MYVPMCPCWLEVLFPISCIFFNKCLYFLYYVDGYLLDRHHKTVIEKGQRLLVVAMGVALVEISFDHLNIKNAFKR